MYRTISANLENLATAYVSFDIKDKYKRVIGAQITTYTVDMLPAAEKERIFYCLAPGHYFTFIPHATRDEKAYGASQPERYFPTVEAREKAIKKYVAAARTRALKIGR